jgi:hypothetical protein
MDMKTWGKKRQSSKPQNVLAKDGAAGSELASALLGTLRYPCQVQACEKKGRK